MDLAGRSTPPGSARANGGIKIREEFKLVIQKKTVEQVAQKASICLKNRENVPTAPLWHLGKAQVFGVTEGFDLVQSTIDYLACKAKINSSFTDDEKEFLVNIYEAFWWGGKYLGFSEAALLANHYVHGGGHEVILNPFVYRYSVIVQDAIVALKKYISNRQNTNKFFAIAKTSDVEFQRSKFADPLRSQNRHKPTQGNIVTNDGTLKAEEINVRLKYTDNRFYLMAATSYQRNLFFTRWSVSSLYDFVDYADEQDDKNITEIPLNGRKLRLPDGLSNHMEKIGIAKKFWYRVEWHEHWRVG
ncbi:MULTISPECIES: hypothetical protein [unclassified Acidovorax]|uniref:hypothetical protein n=1 Tax=unclassified Acidovorax TaxID=2684926 RepID=UPI0012E16921|nr:MULTISPECIES: hypothetical protein [unclassified Acidovorax]